MSTTELLHRWYAGRLRRQLVGRPTPVHVGLIIDGNRRWARQTGLATIGAGHRRGAEHVEEVLGWCRRAGVEHVSVFVCSTDNLRKRGPDEVAFLMRVVEEVAHELTTRPDPWWQLHLVGLLDVLPDSTARALKEAVEATATDRTGGQLTLAIGYGGREEVVDAVRELLIERGAAGAGLAEIAADLSTADIAGHLDTAGAPEPDLIIRTSGEQRLSGFLLWQSVRAQLHFCDAYWPAFREIDFLRALRTFAARRAD